MTHGVPDAEPTCGRAWPAPCGPAPCGSLLGGGLLDYGLRHGLLDCGLLHGLLDCLLRGGLSDGLLGGDRPGCLLACGLPDRLLGGDRPRRLLGSSLPDGLLDCRLLDGLPGSARCYATLHCWSFRREALCARDNRFELSAGTKCRHGGGLNFHRLAGARISRDPGCTTALLENAETGNGDAVTLMHRAHDGVDDVLHRRGCLPTIRAQFLREYVDELRFVHAKPPKPVVLLGPTRGHGKPNGH